jgi:diguanylate cyclase (GGDEF)-like protein
MRWYQNGKNAAKLKVEVAQRTEELSNANHKLRDALDKMESLSFTDELTGLRNRRYLNLHFKHEVAHLFGKNRDKEHARAEDSQDYYLFLLDIDRFKSVNDTYGHDAGDEVLVEFAKRIKTLFRPQDYFIRWGGEEFVIVAKLPDAGIALKKADGIKKIINKASFKIGKQASELSVSCSIGCVNFNAITKLSVSSEPTLSEAIIIADKLLYAAKESGRDTWILLHTLPPNITSLSYLHSVLSELGNDCIYSSVSIISWPGDD